MVTVSNAVDATPPSVSLTAPAAGYVLGTVSVTATATDNIGVSGVQFLLNGANLGTEVTTAHLYGFLEYYGVANGSYALTARARDAAGNTTTSTAVNVIVNNGNLIVALPLNEASGTTATDISGNSHPGTLVNGPTRVAGKYGNGVNFDGTNDQLRFTDHVDFTLAPATSYTWSTWVKVTSFKAGATVWSQTLNANNYFIIHAQTSTDTTGGPVTAGVSVLWVNNGGTNRIGIHSTNNVLVAGTWAHITVTYDASKAQASRVTIYVNGVDVTDRTDVGSGGTIASINPGIRGWG